MVMVTCLDSPLATQNNGWFAKTLFTPMGISSCKLTNFVPLGVCGLDLTPSTIWTSGNINKTLVTIIID